MDDIDVTGHDFSKLLSAIHPADMDATIQFLVDFQAREASGDYCVLCGMRYTDEDYKHAIFVGEGVNGRSVHGSCWAGFRDLCSRLDLDWQSAVNRKRAEREASIPPIGKRPEWAT